MQRMPARKPRRNQGLFAWVAVVLTLLAVSPLLSFNDSASAYAQINPFGVWINPQMGIRVELQANGAYTWQAGGQTSTGQYQFGPNSITMTAYQQTATYHIQMNEQQMMLTDQQGNSLLFNRQGNAAQSQANATQPPAGAVADAAPSGSPLGATPGSEEYFLQFLENYQQMTPDNVYRAFQGLNQNNLLLLQNNAAGAQMCRIMCQSGYGSNIICLGQDCNTLAVQYQQALQFGGTPDEYAERERNQLIIMQKCSLGLIDRGSCGAYMGATQNVNESMNQTNQTINQNIGGAGCTQYYNQDGQYLGCW